MSLEWARVRALQEQMRLRKLVKASEHMDWVGVDAVIPAQVFVCVARMPALKCPSLSRCGVTMLTTGCGLVPDLGHGGSSAIFPKNQAVRKSPSSQKHRLLHKVK